MVRIAVATLSVAAFASVAVQVAAHPISFEQSELDARDVSLDDASELVERGAFGRLGMILRPFISAGRTVAQGHAKANNNFRRELAVEDEELIAREDLESLPELVERGAFGRLGMILRPFISAGRTVAQGHSKANNNFRRDLDIEDELLELISREDLEDLPELVERGAFGRLGMILRPFISAGRTVAQGHAKANSNFRRELDVEDELLDLISREDLESLPELVERGAFGRLGMILRPFISAGRTVAQGHGKANNNFRRDVTDELEERYFGEESEELAERDLFEESLEEMD